MNSKTLAVAVIIAACALSVPATAHPHVFVEAKVEVVFDAGGRVSAVHNIWQFDEAFSQFAIEGQDTNGDGNFSEEELQSLATINVESLEEYGFFTYLKIGDSEAPLQPPTIFGLAFDGRQLTLSYTLPLVEPVPIDPQTMLEIFDPQYFVAFAFSKQAPVTLIDAPAGCSATHHEPEELDMSTMNVLSQIPMDQRTLPPDLAEATKSLANYVALDCPGMVESATDASGVPWPIKAVAATDADTVAGVGGTGLQFSPLLLVPFAIVVGGLLIVLVRRSMGRA